MRKIVLFIIMILFLSYIPISVRAGTCMVEIIPSSGDIHVGDLFNVSVWVSIPADCRTTKITLEAVTFDEDHYQMVSYNDTSESQRGNVLDGSALHWWVGGTIDNDNGFFNDTEWCVYTGVANAISGYFCNMTFRAIKEGVAAQSQITLGAIYFRFGVDEWDYGFIEQICGLNIKNLSNVITINASTSVTEQTLTFNGYVKGHNATSCKVGVVYDTNDHGSDLDDWDMNITISNSINNYTTFSKNIFPLNVQEAEYYYAKAWMCTYYADFSFYIWTISNTTEYVLTKPDSPNTFAVSFTDEDTASITWNEATTFGSGTTIQTVVRYKTTGYPTTPLGTDGSTLVYNGTDESYILNLLDPDERYYFRAWTCAHASGSPHLYQYSGNYVSATASTFEAVYNITVRYENRTYGPVDLTTGHNHQFIVHYSQSTEENFFNKTGEMNGGDDSVGYWDKVSDGWFNISTSKRPLFFSFSWNASRTYINETGDNVTTIFSCYRVIVPEDNQRNITFYIRDDLPVYGDSSYYKNDSLVRYTMSFIDTSGEFTTQNNPYAIIYCYDENNNKLIIHSEYFDASKQIIPWLLYDKRYYIGTKCDVSEFERISTFIAGDDQNPKIIIPYEYSDRFNFFDLIELKVGKSVTGLFFNVQDSTSYATSITLYIYGYDNNTLMPGYPLVKNVNAYNFSYNCNKSKAWKYNIKVVILDNETEDKNNFSGTYWLVDEKSAVIFYPEIDTIITIDKINDIFQIMFGDSPMYDDDGNYIQWTYIALLGFSCLILFSFGKINAFVGALATGLFLMASGGFIYGLISTVVGVGVFIMAISIIGLLGGVDTR